MENDPVLATLGYLKTNKLILTTAESCTAGCMVALLAAVLGTGEVLESGYVVYSPSAKKRLLGVSAETIDRYGLTRARIATPFQEGCPW
ncbi:Nicotinamide-nucleotide amidohydrolase PncC [Pseudomonas sp. IsoF]|nr:Nicotinamide-nucleotide amidohydrolase PncC [Pseudomonas sp. IsoF]